MKGKDLMEGISFIDERFIHEAENQEIFCTNKIHHIPFRNILKFRKRWIAAVAACCMISVPVFAATVPAFYEVLYAISPATAQFFTPIQMSCEDNGIRMEVLASYIHGDTAEIYIAMQDLEGNRFDETIDLFDRYHINMPFDAVGHCALASYDSETKTANFLITIQQWNQQPIQDKKVTFSLTEFLGKKYQYQGTLSDIDLTNANLNPMIQVVEPRGFSGERFDEHDMYATAKDGMTVLKSGKVENTPVDGVTITGIGYIEGDLHVQVYYDDILKTDNHGMISLKNKENGEMILSCGSVSFFDEDEVGSYEDYIFSDISIEKLQDYELYGEFMTSDGSITGNWNVTFPIENKEMIQ